MKYAKLIIGIVILWLMNGCCMDPICPELTNEEASWFPYSKNDTLFFSSKVSDSVLYFPIKSHGSGSAVYPSYLGGECDKYCRASSLSYSDCYFNNTEIFNSTFLIDKVEDEMYVVISPTSGTTADFFSSVQYFDYRKATILDTYRINGNLLNNVYQYICYPQQEVLAETYVKKGIGLVKIVFRNGQEFELVEHIKAK
jgi:hypothetical protein